MKFEEIFNEDGLYTSKDFAKGFCFKIKDGTMTAVEYDNETDLFPREENFPVYKGLFTKEYNKVFTIKSLFKK